MKILTIMGLLLAIAAPASASERLAASTTPNDSPVTINACGANLADTDVGNVNYYINEAVQFTNDDDKGRTAIAVRFSFTLLDAFNAPLRTLYGDASGQFSPGVEINPHYNITGERWDKNVWSAINIDPNVAAVQCKVEAVRFADGTVWSGQ